MEWTFLSKFQDFIFKILRAKLFHCGMRCHTLPSSLSYLIKPKSPSRHFPITYLYPRSTSSKIFIPEIFLHLLLCLCLDNSARAAVAKVPSPCRRPRAANAMIPCSLDSDSSVLLFQLLIGKQK